ncbi:VOC family protein [Alteromonas sp. CYL-A6]|uniref:VOC family protein n=1 Tax=Alteromonas nitratireducens TaxID=3390813 RepID=UPI0034B7643C
MGISAWCDISVADADSLCEFYAQVCGWQREAVPMNGYNDYVMKDSDGKVVGGICHAAGPNSALPPVWLMYFAVDNLDVALNAVVKQGGEMLGNVRQFGDGRYCAIRDVAGACCALYETAEK